MKFRHSRPERHRATLGSTALGSTVLGSTVLATTVLAAGLGLMSAPAMALATGPAPAETGDTECAVTASELKWGVKESFRSYISGSIANGEWTTADGATYETPSFIWNTDNGDLAPDLSAGSIAFTGSVNFTGHDGALSMDIANPAVEFSDNGAAYLLLDFGATDTASEGDPEISQIRAAKIELDGSVDAAAQDLTVTDAPVRLTSEGAEAFNGAYGDYAAGDEMDPISMTATVAGCELGAVEAAPEAQEPEDDEAETAVPADEEAAETASPEIPWLPIIIGGVAILVIGVTTGMLLSGRGKGKNDGAADSAGTSADPDAAASQEGPGESPGSAGPTGPNGPTA